ncbi:MAG: 1-acyl-sn-glycerol-3-phosphate acyltransferase [Phycisphaerales bacterium]|nr:1-acyl-sn-glycerol-3-phosphate acyltransferase [Phycisphaerales bacterium]
MNANIDVVSLPLLVILLLALLAALGVLSHRLMDNPRVDVNWGLAIAGARIYARLVHRLRIEGLENVPVSREPGPLILVVNHTAGVDPLLVQSACPFEIRWMMAADMQVEAMKWAWEWLRVIRVDRIGRDTTSAREAIRHLEQGGVVGIFPEGAIERPPRQVRPFFPGVGLLIARSGAPVLPVVVDGTPHGRHAWESLFRTSRSTVRFFPLVRYSEGSAGEITRDLRDRYIAWTGWPANDTPRANPGVEVSEPQRHGGAQLSHA